MIANDDDVERALRACERMVLTLPDQRDAAIFALGSTGLRRSNVCAVRLSVVQRALAAPVRFEGQEFYVLNTGGKEPMEAVLDDRLARIVRRYMEHRPKTAHDRLFVNLNCAHASYLEPLSNEGMIRARRRVCLVADVPLISFQKMRRLTGTKVARRFGLEVAAAVLGHRSGTDVVRKHYYDPDKEAARLAALTALSHGRNWGDE
ncbi:MAG: site-specific integrase [Anaerolineae bacterium]|nr:site-specific integrase [Anaerolineae bacterium]